MNNTPLDLTTQHTLALLQQLKKAVAEAAQAEEHLASEMRTRRFNADRKLHKAEEGIDGRVTSQFAEAEAVFGAREERARKAHEDREARLKRYKNSSSRNLQSMAQEQRERFLGGVQMKRVTMERAHARKVQAIEQRHAAEQARLAEFDVPLLNLQKAVKKAFSGYGSYLALLSQPVEIAATTDHNEQVTALEEMLGRAQRRYVTFRKNALPRFFSTMPLMMLIALFAVLGVVLAIGLGADQKGMVIGGAVAVAGILGSVVLHMIGRKQGDADAEEAATTLGAVRALHRGAVATSNARRDEELAAEKQAFESEFSKVKDQWEGADKVQADFETKIKTKLATKVPELIERNDSILGSKLRYLNAKRDELKRKLDEEAAAQKKVHVLTRDRTMTEIVAEEAQRFGEIEKGWKAEVQPLWAELEAMRASPAMNFPAWSKAYLDAWSAPREFSAATRYGSVTLDLAAAGLPKDPRLALPGDATLVQPLGLSYPAGGSLLIESDGASDGVVSNALNTVLLRLICTTPPGKIAFTILDPVGLGQNFAGFMHLGDYEETLINRRIWTQRDQIEERLAELNDHIEKVIQMYLRNEYETITQYNEQAGSVAEKYHFLVVADFPAGFSDVAAKRLQSIAVSGPRCGVYTIIHRDLRQSLPDGFVADELKQASVCITLDRQGRFALPAAPEGSVLALDAPPPDDLAVPLVHKIGKASVDSNRVEVPFTQIAPKPDELWTNDTTNELRIPIGRTGATKLQYLAIGKGTRQHALFAGKTGSGKSTLFHVIITNLALACSPDQVEFYLIDFKKGVEFKCYATNRLPHARVVAIESDREFGLSVLQRVDEELKRRGDMFRKLGVQDVAGYKRAGGTEPMPRTLLLIDEFQEFFVEDDTVAQNASLLFDRIVRQGRAFGIHVLLGSQTLGGAFTLARATMGQMVIRVALQCNEADAYLIMDENNPAPRLLTRPGEGIYNDSAGAIEGNSPFQVVWLGDEERDACLHKVRQLAEERHDPHRGPIVFEGNAPADIRENYALAAALARKPEKAPPAGRVWLGAPNSIKGPTEAVFHRQSGNHLLIVGQREEVALSMLGLGLIALASQYSAGGAKYYFFHTTTPETPDARFVERMLGAVPDGVRVVRGHDVPDAMAELAEMLAERTASGGQDAPPVYVFIHGLQKFKKLKSDDDLDFSFSSSDSGPSPASQFSSLITEGSSHGIHLITSVDTYNNVMRFLSRKLLTEFEMRLVFQMSANDSASLIDSPRAANLGMHRALLHNEQEGSLETFRPYAEPDGQWLDEAAEKLRQR